MFHRLVRHAAAAALGVAAAAAAVAQGSPPLPSGPQLLLPGLVSTGDVEFSPAFEPDGRTLYFSKGGPSGKPVFFIVVSRRSLGAWGPPEIAPFSGRYSDIDPTLSPDGKHLFFASTRPLSGSGPPKDFDIWVMDRAAGGWSEPRNLGAPVNSPGAETTTSVTADGTLYVGASGRSGDRKGRQLFRAPRAGGRYASLTPLPAPIDGGEEDSNQYVSPDERFMIFLSRRGGAEPALYLSERRGETWTPPIALDAALNATYSPYTPLLSADRRTLYFTSRRGTLDTLPAPRMPYARFLELIRSPGNGLADVYSVETSTLPALAAVLKASKK